MRLRNSLPTTLAAFVLLSLNGTGARAQSTPIDNETIHPVRADCSGFPTTAESDSYMGGKVEFECTAYSINLEGTNTLDKRFSPNNADFAPCGYWINSVPADGTKLDIYQDGDGRSYDLTAAANKSSIYAVVAFRWYRFRTGDHTTPVRCDDVAFRRAPPAPR